MKIYSPCKDTLKFLVDGQKHELPPGMSTRVDRKVGSVAASQFAKFGVIEVPDSRYKSKVDAAIKDAQIRWVFANRRWSEEILLDWHQSNKDKIAAGIKPEETDEVLAAKKFLGGK